MLQYLQRGSTVEAFELGDLNLRKYKFICMVSWKEQEKNRPLKIILKPYNNRKHIITEDMNNNHVLNTIHPLLLAAGTPPRPRLPPPERFGVFQFLYECYSNVTNYVGTEEVKTYDG